MVQSICLITFRYKENNSEVIDHQDINETIIEGVKIPNKRSRQFLDLKIGKKKLNDTNFETMGLSRDNLV